MEEQDRSLWSGYKGLVIKGSPIPPIQQYSAKRSSYAELFRRYIGMYIYAVMMMMMMIMNYLLIYVNSCHVREPDYLTEKPT